MSANDIRELENLDRIPAGGWAAICYLINGNMTKLADAGSVRHPDGYHHRNHQRKGARRSEEILELDPRRDGPGRARAAAGRAPSPRKAGLTTTSRPAALQGGPRLPAPAPLPSGSTRPAATAWPRRRSTTCSWTIPADVTVQASTASPPAPPRSSPWPGTTRAHVAGVHHDDPQSADRGHGRQRRNAPRHPAAGRGQGEHHQRLRDQDRPVAHAGCRILWMAETWMNANKALELGFCDEIMY